MTRARTHPLAAWPRRRIRNQRGAHGTHARECARVPVVLADAASADTSRRSRKIRCGYEWTRCSSAPKARSASSPKSHCASTATPKRIAAAVCSFDSIEGASIPSSRRSNSAPGRAHRMSTTYRWFGEKVLQANYRSRTRCSSVTRPDAGVKGNRRKKGAGDRRGTRRSANSKGNQERRSTALWTARPRRDLRQTRRCGLAGNWANRCLRAISKNERSIMETKRKT